MSIGLHLAIMTDTTIGESGLNRHPPVHFVYISPLLRSTFFDAARISSGLRIEKPACSGLYFCTPPGAYLM